MHRTALRIAAALLALAPTVAFAHPGHDGASLVHGFLHPLGGVDHIIAMVAVGLLAARLGGRALWLGSAGLALATGGGGGDHIIAMVASVLVAVRLGCGAVWLVPASFVIAMAAAGVAGMAGIALPY